MIHVKWYNSSGTFDEGGDTLKNVLDTRMELLVALVI